MYEQKNVIYNNFDLGNYYIDERKFNELISFKIKPGDVLITCSGTVGKIAVVPENAKEGIINQALLKITLDYEIIDKKYFVNLFRFKIDEILLSNTRGSAMLNISSVEDLKKIGFPIPPIDEQDKIVEEIERRFSVADNIEKFVEQSLKQAERLRQSILKKAFEGKLVPQDSSDEPAEKLLERIYFERNRKVIHKDLKSSSKKKLKEYFNKQE